MFLSWLFPSFAINQTQQLSIRHENLHSEMKDSHPGQSPALSPFWDWSPIELDSIHAVELELQNETSHPLYIEFNSVLSNAIVGATFFLVLNGIAFGILRRYKRNEDDHDHETGSFLP
eukprot:TRINITY_DN8987_c1_g1_i1.p1 TRINITY_DN8987_c1_g1~~TRINITY_DN8987_c1_g1_i1.p1  ORF type:complete len:118 (+),score=20.24 TRINITY_DN8987_c1_g1_i1:92-445(+)